MKNINDSNEKKRKANNYYGFIYITTNKINGKKYIGKKKYCGNYETYLGSGIAIKNEIAKYGRENFTREIIEECGVSYDAAKIQYKKINSERSDAS